MFIRSYYLLVYFAAHNKLDSLDGFMSDSSLEELEAEHERQQRQREREKEKQSGMSSDAIDAAFDDIFDDGPHRHYQSKDDRTQQILKNKESEEELEFYRSLIRQKENEKEQEQQQIEVCRRHCAKLRCLITH